jgi:predicted ABC-type ATPase
MIVLAGPNGAGKSTLYRTRVKPMFAGPFVNADDIQLNEFGDLKPEAAYEAAEIAARRRSEIISRGGDLVTETVLSHPSKLDLLKEARERGYTIFVMHVGVETPDLSVARVAHRVDAGGHDVPENKIRERFDRSGPLIRKAVLFADEGLVYDNSRAALPPDLILHFRQGSLVKTVKDPPPWIKRIYANDLHPT